MTFVGKRTFCSKLVKTKSCIMISQNLVRCARKVYVVNEWTIIRDIQLCPKPTATSAGKPTFDYVPSSKSFAKIHFLFVLSISLPPRLLSSLCSLIVVPYPYPGI